MKESLQQVGSMQRKDTDTSHLLRIDNNNITGSNHLRVPRINDTIMMPRHSTGSSQSESDQASGGVPNQSPEKEQKPPDMNKHGNRNAEVAYLHPFEYLLAANREEYENVTLMYVKHEKIPMKDFGSEVRATMDIDHLLNKAVLLLDLPETSLEEIFGKIIHVMDIQEPEFTSEQVKNALFTQDAGNQFHILSRTVQSICTTNIGGGTYDYDQAWICALCMLPTVQHRHVAIARLSHPTNLGRTMQDLRFIIIVIAPARAKGTKTGLETARTFATLLADLDIRQKLVMASTADQFRQTLLQAAKELAVEQSQLRERKVSIHFADARQQILGPNAWFVGRGLRDDIWRRWRYYASDYLDGISDRKTIQKVLSTTVSVYFACLLPSIAFGVLNSDNTKDAMGVKKAIYAQAIGGLFFSLFGGQPMIIILTTAPLALYTKIIYKISHNFGINFFAMYAWCGLWCQLFLVLYALTELSNIMKWATRSAEEMFSLFIALAFVVESFKALSGNFKDNYHSPLCKAEDEFSNISSLHGVNGTDVHACRRESSLLYLLLMLGTLWIGLFLYNFKKTPYLTVAKRELLADYSFPAAVILMSFCGSYCFKHVHIDKFEFDETIPVAEIAEIWKVEPAAIFGAMGLGFCLSLLFFIDQNMTSAIVNNQQNKLRKGSATHLDLFVVAILNIFLSLLGLPWMHAALPHSPIHVRALADVEERVQQGHVHEVITNVRETRLSAMIAHILIGLSAVYLLPEPLVFIPKSVLDGLFLYMAAISLHGSELFERIMLLFTEQAAYPPTHYIRRVPQRKVHLFTVCQLIQLASLCAFGFVPVPYVEMIFPMVIFSFLPIRHLLIPKIIDYKYLDALDGRH